MKKSRKKDYLFYVLLILNITKNHRVNKKSSLSFAFERHFENHFGTVGVGGLFKKKKLALWQAFGFLLETSLGKV